MSGFLTPLNLSSVFIHGVITLPISLPTPLIQTSRIESLSAPQLFPVLVATGDFHALCLSDEGELYVWGSGPKGQLGLGMDTTLCNTPKIV